MATWRSSLHCANTIAKPIISLSNRGAIKTPYRDRRIHVVVRESRTEAVYVVRDEGPGFDPSTLPDPTDPANLEKCSGRGLLLIRTFMDHVDHDNQGREITMIKRCESNTSD